MFLANSPISAQSRPTEVDIELDLTRAPATAAVQASWTEPAQGESCWRFGSCSVRPACREVVVGGEFRYLQPRPFDLLVHLIECRDRVVTADELLDAVWGEQEVQPGALSMAIARVRAVLQDAMDGRGEAIRTYHRIGYRFVAPIEGDVIAAAG
jgi:DNA-binding winged helix-turn-helix (wHTH) protein